MVRGEGLERVRRRIDARGEGGRSAVLEGDFGRNSRHDSRLSIELLEYHHTSGAGYLQVTPGSQNLVHERFDARIINGLIVRCDECALHNPRLELKEVSGDVRI